LPRKIRKGEKFATPQKGRKKNTFGIPFEEK
jgi:hypothetical protein